MSNAEDVQGRVGNYQALVSDYLKRVEDVWVAPPEIDIGEQVQKYCENLRSVTANQREAKLEKHVTRLVDDKLTNWVTTVSPLDDIAKQVHSTRNRMNDEKDEITRRQDTLDHRIKEDQKKIENFRDQKLQHERREQQMEPSGSYALVSAWIMMGITLLLGVLAAYYYVGVLGRITIAQNGGVYRGLTIEEFSVVKFLTLEPANFVYIFGALIFLAAGKLISVIYSNLNHPSWMMISFATLAVVITIGSVLLFGTVQNLTIDIQLASQSVKDLITQTSSLDLNTGETVNKCIAGSGGADPACEKLAETRATLVTANQSMAGFSFWLTLSVMFAEIAFGSVAWMYMARYYEQSEPGRKAVRQQIESFAEQESQMQDSVAQGRDQIKVLKTSQDDIDVSLGSLAGLQTKMHSIDDILKQKQRILNRELAQADAIYHSVIDAWDKNAPRAD